MHSFKKRITLHNKEKFTKIKNICQSWHLNYVHNCWISFIYSPGVKKKKKNSMDYGTSVAGHFALALSLFDML